MRKFITGGIAATALVFSSFANAEITSTSSALSLSDLAISETVIRGQTKMEQLQVGGDGARLVTLCADGYKQVVLYSYANADFHAYQLLDENGHGVKCTESTAVISKREKAEANLKSLITAMEKEEKNKKPIVFPKTAKEGVTLY